MLAPAARDRAWYAALVARLVHRERLPPRLARQVAFWVWYLKARGHPDWRREERC